MLLKSQFRPGRVGSPVVRLPHVLVEPGIALGDARVFAVVGVAPVDHIGGDAGDGEQVEPVGGEAHRPAAERPPWRCGSARSPCGWC
jgi:hypothetical protein